MNLTNKKSKKPNVISTGLTISMLTGLTVQNLNYLTATSQIINFRPNLAEQK